MSCCKGGPPIDGIYIPLNKRFIMYGEEAYGEHLLEKFPRTYIWLFTFYEDSKLCQECSTKLSDMGAWFNKYGLFDNVIRNVKWVVDDDIQNNMILRDLNVKKTPIHFFCDDEGKIIDIIYGFPTTNWLEKYILPLVS